MTSGFAQLTKQLMELADGHLVMSLEGGYSLPSLCDAAEACLRGLLTQEVSILFFFLLIVLYNISLFIFAVLLVND